MQLLCMTDQNVRKISVESTLLTGMDCAAVRNQQQQQQGGRDLCERPAEWPNDFVSSV